MPLTPQSQPAPTTLAAPGGNVYVGPTLTSSLVRFVGAIVTARG